MLDYTSFESTQKGPNLLITGAVHGNEACGTIAIRQWIDLLNSNKETILCGTVRFIPICNPRDFEKNERFMEENLNRVITPSNTPKSYEHTLAQDIITHLDWADYHLDLHSYTADDIPFAFCERDDQHLLNFVSASAPASYIMTESDRMLADQGITDFNCLSNYALNNDTYSFLLECGQHKSPNAPIIAYEGIKNTLAYLGMIEPYDTQRSSPTIIRSSALFYKEKDGYLEKRWANFEPVKKGQLLATYDDGEALIAPYDCVVYLCKHDTLIGHEWFYLGCVS